MILQEPHSRKHRPAETRPASVWMLRPRLGWLSGLALLALAIAQLAGVPAHDPALENPLSHVWLATIWAGWAAAVWITIQPPLNPWRIGAAGLLLVWHCGIMALTRQQPFARYVMMFAGFGIFQVTAAVVLRLPRWKLPGPVQSLPPRQGQFGILSLLVLMTVAAGVLRAARSYGDAGGAHFMSGAVVVLLMLTVVAANAIAAASFRRWGVAAAVLMLFTAAASAAVMARQEIMAAEGGDFAEYWQIYFTIEAVFAMILYGVGLCGRLDAAAPPPLTPPR